MSKFYHSEPDFQLEGENGEKTGSKFILREALKEVDWDELIKTQHVTWDTKEYRVVGYSVDEQGKAKLTFKKIEGVE